MSKYRELLFRKGMLATELVVRLAEHRSDIIALRFANYRVHPNVEDRVGKHAASLDRKLIRTARKLVAEYRLPLWVGVLSTYSKLPGTSSKLIREVLRHDKRYDYEFDISRKDLTQALLEQIITELKPGYVLALCSRVHLQNQRVVHIPMIDFRVQPSAANVKKVEHALKKIGQVRGILLNSGRSFHYYGLELLSEEEWRIFLGKCLLLSPMIDPRYVAHRLIDGLCRLRISATKEKPKIPEVVELI